MAPSQLFGIIAVIIVVLLIISIAYFDARAKAEATVINTVEGQMVGIAHHHTLMAAHPIFSYSEEPSIETSARPLGRGDALVVHGIIPRSLPYWGITGYLYSVGDQVVHAAVGDSISNGIVTSLASGDGVVVIMTANPYMYEEVKERLLKEWHATNHRYPLRIYPMYIPLEMQEPRVINPKYTMTVKTVLRTPTQQPPQFKCTLFTSHNINYKDVVIPPLRDRSTAPKEHDTLSEPLWHQAAINALQTKNYVMLREIPVGLALGDLDVGAHAFTKDGTTNYPNCKGDNRDVTVFETGPIVIEPNESLVVVSVNHVMSHRSTYSTITFSHDQGIYSMYTTGDSLHRYQRGGNRNSTITAQMTLNNAPPGVNTVYIQEHIYNEPFTNIGPCPRSVLPMKVFVIRHTEVA